MIIPGRILGIFWVTASWIPTHDCGPAVQFTNTEEGPLQEINVFLCAELKKTYSIYSFRESKRKQEFTFHRMKIYSPSLIRSLRKDYLWRGRKEDPRYYPPNLHPEQEKGFLKYYLKSKATIDKNGRRLRIYGNWNLLNDINQRLSDILGVGLKTPQRHPMSDIMQILYYQSRQEVETIEAFME